MGVDEFRLYPSRRDKEFKQLGRPPSRRLDRYFFAILPVNREDTERRARATGALEFECSTSPISIRRPFSRGQLVKPPTRATIFAYWAGSADAECVMMRETAEGCRRHITVGVAAGRFKSLAPCGDEGANAAWPREHLFSARASWRRQCRAGRQDAELLESCHDSPAREGAPCWSEGRRV